MFMSSSCAFWLSITLHQPEAKGSELVPEILQAEHFRRPKGGRLVPRRQAHGAFVEVGLWPRPRIDCDQGPRETLHGRGHQDFQVLPDPTWKLRKLACWSPNASQCSAVHAQGLVRSGDSSLRPKVGRDGTCLSLKPFIGSLLLPISMPRGIPRAALRTVTGRRPASVPMIEPATSFRCL